MGKLSNVSCLCVMPAALMLLDCSPVIAQTQQEHVHGMSHSVMPFEMAKTVQVTSPG